MKQLGIFIVCSLIFHFLLTTSTLYFAEKFQVARNRPEVTQIEIIDSVDESLQSKIEKSRQLIKQLQTSVKKITDPDSNARFDSEKTQRVERETKSSKLGITQNSAPKIKIQLPGKSEVKSQERNEEQSKDRGDLPEFARSRPNIQQMPIAQDSSVSSILPNDITDSNATNLNTDANTYYSFYSRIEDLFYVRWVERVRYYWDRISVDYKKTVLGGKSWSTTLEVWLTSTGEFHSAYIKQPSGYKAFDEAAVFAFKNARFFPNPPRAKVESDGFVRLRYRFSVHVADY